MIEKIKQKLFSKKSIIGIIGLRFFTVYGPWGRPDMALFKFVKLGLQKKAISLFNYGNHIRDFTYIDDVVEFTKRAFFKIPDSNKKITNYSSKTKWIIYNVCSSKPIKLKKFIEEIEKNIGTKIKFKNLKLQSGDVIKNPWFK